LREQAGRRSFSFECGEIDMSLPKTDQVECHRLPIRECLVVVAFVWLLGITGCNGQIRAIESVLQADKGTSANAKSIGEIVTRMRAIDGSKCPKEFQSAYLTHIHAWERGAQWERRAAEFHKNSSEPSQFVESFVRGFLGDPLGKMNEVNAARTEFEREAQAIQKEIQQTFQDVEKVALKYGAKLPQAKP
jgi:hypothetical protein